MRFKSAVLFISLLAVLLISFQSKSYAIEQWNLISERSYSGFGTVESAASLFNSAVGDFNGDNIDDIAIGFPEQESGGAVYIALGDGTSFSTSAALIISDSGTGQFGYSVANAGDIDNDGIDDLIIGAPNESTAYLILGTLIRAQINGDGLINITNGDFVSLKIVGTTDTAFGATVAGVGDMDGNGRPEVMIREVGTGKVNVFVAAYLALKARETNLIDLNAGDFANYVIEGTSTGFFGQEMGAAGDINNDGYGDVVISNPASEATPGGGSISIYLGASTIDTRVDMMINSIPYTNDSSGEYINTLFGYSIATNFDIDNDGYSDILVGAPNSGPVQNAGIAYLYFGSSITSQMSSRSVYSHDLNDYIAFFGEAENDLLGASMGALDANGDGYDDIVIGAPFAKDNGTGRVYYLSGKSRASLRNVFDTTMVGSFTTDDSGSLGEGFGFHIAVGENMTEINKGDLYIFSAYSGLIKQCAIIQTPSNVLGGTISAANGNNHITSANSPYYVRADINVPRGETLTIDPGVTIKFNTVKFSAGGYSEDLLEINVLGTLIAAGTSGQGFGNEDIQFTMNSLNPIKGGWMGINLDDGGTARISNVGIGYGVNGIWVDRANLTLSNSKIYNNGGEFRSLADCDGSANCSPPAGIGVFVQSGNLGQLNNNLITNNDGDGLNIISPENDTDQDNVLTEISRNEFSNNGGGGIINADSGLIVSRVTNNTVTFNGGDGISGFERAVISENFISSNQGNGITSVTNCVISNNLVDNSDSTGIDAGDSCEVKNNVIIYNETGVNTSSGVIVRENYIGVRENGEAAPNITGISASDTIEILKNHVSYNVSNGIDFSSNPDDSAPAVIWQNEITYNGENGILLSDASPYIVGNNIINNGSRGIDKQANGIKSDNLSRPKINQNNIYGNSDMGLRLYHNAPTSANKFFSLAPHANWWGTTALNEIYDIIWDYRDDDISILGTVTITSPARSEIDITKVAKPSSSGTPIKSVLECFIATASFYDDLTENKKEENNKGIFEEFLDVISNVTFLGGK